MRQLSELQAQNERLAGVVRKMEATKGLSKVDENICESCEDTSQMRDELKAAQEAY
jgi:hypothetical protein